MELTLPTQKLMDLQAAWNTLGADALYMSHYELAENTNYSVLDWREFLTNPDVVDWINKETMLIQQSKLRLLMKDIDGNTKSTGLPQLINTLVTQTEKKDPSKDGPAFIYCFVPLNEQEEGAPNVRIETNNPFAVKGPK